MIKDKKGKFRIRIWSIILILVLLSTILGAIFSSSFRLFLIGLGLVVFTLLLVFGSDKINKQKLLIASIIILVGLFILLIPYFGGFQQTAFGSSTLSLSQASLESTNPFFSGQSWLLTFTSGKLSQRYTGVFSPDLVDSVSPGTSKPTKTFALDVEYSDTVCEYPITKVYSITPIYDFKIVEWGCVLPTEAAAKERLFDVFYYGKYALSFTCWAIGYDTRSPVSPIDSPNVGSEYTIYLDVGGKIATKTINTLSGSTGGPIGDFAYAQWQGNLVSGQACPDKDPYKVAYVNGLWRIISSQEYNNYINYFNNNFRVLDRLAQTGTKNDINDLFIQMRNRAEIAKTTVQGFGTINNINNIDNAKINIVSDTPLQFPVTTLYIKASELGVYTPVPEFRIDNTKSECFETGKSGVVSTTITNIGDERGIGNIYLECPSTFTPTANREIYFNPGETKTITLPLTSTTTEKLTGVCDVVIESTGVKKTKSVSVCVQPLVTCLKDPSETFCDFSTSGNDAIYRCSQSGSTKELVEECLADEICVQSATKGECVKDVEKSEDLSDEEKFNLGLEECNNKALANPLLGYEWVTTTKQPSLFEKIISFGTAKPTIEGYCKATYSIYYFVGIFGIIMIVLIYFLIRSFDKKKRKKK